MSSVVGKTAESFIKDRARNFTTYRYISHDVCIDCLLLFYTITTVFQLYHGGDMMYEMRRGKHEPTLLPTQRISNLLHHLDMPGTGL